MPRTATPCSSPPVPRTSSQNLLGAVRVELADRAGLLKPDDFAFTWVVDFPLFKSTEDEDDDDVAVGHSKWTSMHHPFTMPSADWIDTFDQDPEHAMSDSYDIVCNGEEMGGGSVRIHRDDIQDRVLDVLGISKEEADEKFGFLLEAFKYGRPAARRHRPGLGPHRLDPGRHRHHPRRHRLPEGRRRPRTR